MKGDVSDPRSPTLRFSDRVDDYVRHRPGYPPELYDYLRTEVGLVAHSVVADIGSGSGTFSRGLLELGAIVYGVEPNDAMRRAAERLLADSPAFRSVDGTAEATSLAESTVDAVTAAQAFHWFRLDQTRLEFARILRPAGAVVLVWNRRLTDVTPFARAYEELLLEHGTDYLEVDHRREQRNETLDRFFRPQSWREARFASRQVLDWDGLLGRLMSSSYVPGRDSPEHRPMVDALRRVFEAYNVDGTVPMDYDTEVYHGILDSCRR